ncbi:MAG TPA: hypothetical protein VLO13_00940, partial [Halomonas sp.]|nr:hypothetical protein [Halomonas sp.]
MKPSLQTRKPINELNPEDLEAFPIWEFAIDEEENEEQDETWVSPVRGNVIDSDEYSLSVSANFITASGKAISGAVDVTTADEFEFGHAFLLYDGSYIFVSSEKFPDPNQERNAVALALGLPVEKVFPLKFTLRVLIEGE